MIKNKKNTGFTLIELILVIAIIGIIASTTFVAFNRFSDKQNLNIGFDNLRSALNEAKSNAQSQVVNKCTGELKGYQISFNSSSRTYNLNEICNPILPNPVVKTYPPLPSGVRFNGNPASITFSTLTGDATVSTVIITNGSQQRTIGVKSSGVIYETE